MYGESFGHFITHEPLWLTVYSGHEVTQFPLKQYGYLGLQNSLGHSNSFIAGFVQYLKNPLSAGLLEYVLVHRTACSAIRFRLVPLLCHDRQLRGQAFAFNIL